MKMKKLKILTILLVILLVLTLGIGMWLHRNPLSVKKNCHKNWGTAVSSKTATVIPTSEISATVNAAIVQSLDGLTTVSKQPAYLLTNHYIVLPSVVKIEVYNNKKLSYTATGNPFYWFGKRGTAISKQGALTIMSEHLPIKLQWIMGDTSPSIQFVSQYCTSVKNVGVYTVCTINGNKSSLLFTTIMKESQSQTNKVLEARSLVVDGHSYLPIETIFDKDDWVYVEANSNVDIYTVYAYVDNRVLLKLEGKTQNIVKYLSNDKRERLIRVPLQIYGLYTKKDIVIECGSFPKCIGNKNESYVTTIDSLIKVNGNRIIRWYIDNDQLLKVINNIYE